MNKLNQLLEAIASHHGINDKSRLADILVAEFGLTKDRSVFYCAEFAIRFSSSAGAASRTPSCLCQISRR